ncbi:hypothetical protein COOONC_23678 [Cooperia oncophora]
MAAVNRAANVVKDHQAANVRVCRRRNDRNTFFDWKGFVLSTLPSWSRKSDLFHVVSM